MSTKAQLLHSDVHGTAMRFAAEKRDLAESISELRQIADGHEDVLAEAAGIAAGMLIMAGGPRRRAFGLQRFGAVDACGL